jgi:quercetin dioxygenase-like cupin family protein
VRIARTSDAPAIPMDTDHFNGPASRRELGQIDAVEGSAIVVSFEAGTRNHWHRHSGGQVLYVLDGVGRVGVRTDTPVEIRPGDLVYAPPAEEHWHGAAEDRPMTHLAFSFGETEFLEPVTDN